MAGGTKLINALPMPAQRSSQQRGRRNIRAGDDENVSLLTKASVREEEERKKRVQDRRAMYDELFHVQSATDESAERLVLDFNVSTKQELVSVDQKLVAKLKAHQREGVRFLWDACFESLEAIEKGRQGGGAILAHCMGLGKTLQIVTLVHTLIRHKETKVRTVLVLCPVSTLLNWKAEFHKWLEDQEDWDTMNIYLLCKKTKAEDRITILEEWARNGGVVIMSYNMFRTMNTSSKVGEKRIYEAFQEPGPDLVVCDEGHVLKNDKNGLSKVMMKISTPKRIILTGTPLQNHLLEYYCMVQFVRPNLLGSKKEFGLRFVNPIENGRYVDSTKDDVELMHERTRLLHSILDGIVQRLDSSVLKPFLPPKQEFVVSVGLSDLQAQLYKYYLDHVSSKSKLFEDFEVMRLIWTHPLATKLGEDTRQEKKKKKETKKKEGVNKSVRGIADPENDSDVMESNLNPAASEKERIEKERTERTDDELGIDFDKINISAGEDKKKPAAEVNELNLDFSKMKISSVEETKAPWWSRFVTEDDFEDREKGPKLVLLFAVLAQCGKIGDKVLIFSQSIPSLNMIEHFLKKSSESGESAGTWEKDRDYFRLDGSTSEEKRQEYCDLFNQEDNKRARLFLISTKAGGLGINLVAANRVVIFDASWNPTYDNQSIFRAYRLGQTKLSYIYRFISQGTMEERIYERQVTKQAEACRVIDEHKINRHFTKKEITELYRFERRSPPAQTLALPSDDVMTHLLQEYKEFIINYHEHDTLLENIQDSSDLTEAIDVQQALEKLVETDVVAKLVSADGESKDGEKRSQAVEQNVKESESEERRPGTEKPGKDCKNVERKPAIVDNKPQNGGHAPRVERPKKYWKENAAEIVNRIKDEWIVEAARKMYPSTLKFHRDEKLLFQVRAKLFHEYKSRPKPVNKLLLSSMYRIPLEIAVDIIQVVEAIVPDYIKSTYEEVEGSKRTEFWNRKKFMWRAVNNVIQKEYIKEKLRQLFPEDWRLQKFRLAKLVEDLRRAFFNYCMHEHGKDEFNQLLFAFVFGNNNVNSIIENQVMLNMIRTVAHTHLQNFNAYGMKAAQDRYNRGYDTAPTRQPQQLVNGLCYFHHRFGSASYRCSGGGCQYPSQG